MKSIENKTKRTTYFIAAFLILSAFILSTGSLFYRYAVKGFQVHIEQELTAIADLKVKEIIQWRKERRGDVSVFYKNDVFSSLVKRYFEKPDDTETLRKIQIWLGNVQMHYNYKRVSLIDSKGVERLSIPKAITPFVATISRRYSDIIKSKQIVFEDFYLNEYDNQINLTVLAPIIDNQDSAHVLGIISLQIDPRHYLYPLISSWPTPSKTSETLILRREGDEVVFLNSLKYKKDAALTLRMPMNGKLAIPAIKAALGEEGIVEALDYRGMPVIAAIRTIHGSPWFMVARMDQTEAYAPLRERLWILTSLVSLLLVIIGIGSGFIWKNQSLDFYRKEYKASKKLIDSEEKFRLLFDTIPDAIFIHDLEGHFLQVNKIACEQLGYSDVELLKMTVKDIDTTEFAEKYDESIKSFVKIGHGVLETEQIRRDGTIILIELSSCMIEFADKPAVLSVARDISERKLKEELLMIQSAALNAAANAIVITNITGKIDWVNPAFTKLTGYTFDEVTGENPRTIKSGKHDAAFYMNLWDTILAGKVWHGEMINKRKDESEYTEEMTITPLKNANGEIIRFIAIKQDITERKQVEEELQKSEENVRLLLDSTAEAIYGIDLEGKCTFSNKSCLKLLGYERSDQLIGMDMHKLIHHSHPDGSPLPKEDCSVYKAFQSGNGTHKDNEVFWRADGTSFPVEYWSYPIFRNGKIEGSVATFLDITERKWIEETQTFLLQCGYSETDGNFFESLTQYLAKTLDMDYVCVDKLQKDLLTAQTVAVYYDGKFEDNIEYSLNGTPCGEVVEKTSCNFPHNTHQLFPNHKLIQEMHAESYIGITLFSNTGQPIGLIAAIDRKPLKNRCLAESILKLVAIRAAGELERKFAEEEIGKLQQQIDYIFGATKTGMNIVDIDFNLNYVSPGLKKIYGNYSGKKCYEYFRASGEECEECLVRKAIETESSIVFETTFPLENNRPVQATIIPFKDIDGKWLAAEVTVDITERKKFEDELSNAKAEAEQANLAKSEFLSRMSHELRTPMNSILGFAQLMDMGELNPTHKKGVDHILKSGKHLLDLINEVLDISKIEAGHISLSLEPIAICPLVKEMLDVVDPLAAGKQITLEVAPHDELFVKADRQRLKQVLLNLVNNAIKYNRQNGFVKIICESIAVAEKQNSTVRISISDSGAGITPEDIKKLFNPFQRIGAEKTETEGTGLGLAVAKKIIEAMHGTIGVESELGKGSTFWIELPQTESQIDSYERLNQTKPEPEKDVLSGTILYIEDNVSNIQLVEQILEAHRPGINLITEMYGKNAVKLATDFTPDLILLDLDLPDIHGSEVLKLLQAGSKTAAIPVVIISADAMSGQVEKLLKLGAKDYLTKPLDIAEFLKVIDEMMKKITTETRRTLRKPKKHLVNLSGPRLRRAGECPEW